MFAVPQAMAIKAVLLSEKPWLRKKPDADTLKEFADTYLEEKNYEDQCKRNSIKLRGIGSHGCADRGNEPLPGRDKCHVGPTDGRPQRLPRRPL